MTSIPQEIFKAYDIRGIVGETLTEENVTQIAKAIARIAKLQQQESIIIARDGRLSGPTLSAALKEGLLEEGCQVIDIGMVPTPVLYFATKKLPSSTGVMLTGSHNPANYNGLKIVIDNTTLSGDKIQEIYQNIIEHSIADTDKTFQKENNHYSQYNIIEDYILAITSTLQLSRQLKIVVDAGNGVAGLLAPKLFKSLGCVVIELFCEVDGHFPNHHPDPSVPENLQALMSAVKEHQADVGLAFDGDGDRIGVVTNLGEIIYPDRLLMLFAKDILSRHPGEKIIFDVKCTQHLPKVIEQYKGIPEMTKTGHSLIKKRLQETQAAMAGEMSGHIFFNDGWYGFDDGLYAGARLLHILSRNNLSCSDIFKSFPNSVNTPELKLAVTTAQKEKILTTLPLSFAFEKAKIIAIDGLRVEFDDAWGLIRASNTTPHMTLRFEGKDQPSLKTIQDIFRQELLKIDPTFQLSF
jgi:phosphomannomutase/phosphoglucomutase